LIAVDTNILVYAHRQDSDWHDRAAPVLKRLAEGNRPWAIAWTCLHEFIGIVTHPKIYKPASTLVEAFAQVETWAQAPALQIISEGTHYFSSLKEIATQGQIRGGQIHDARIAAICLQHGVSELWSADRDFSRFPQLKTRNPLVDA
jgi:uncharacterized protein